MIPVIETERLILRAWKQDDLRPCAVFFADKELGKYRPELLTEVETWEAICADLGQWQLRGYGMWAIEEKLSGSCAGFTGLWHPVDIDEPELCWSLFAGFHGKGYATEAAKAARNWAIETHRLAPPMSYIHPKNEPSIKVAERLGAHCQGPGQLRGLERLIYRHMAA